MNKDMLLGVVRHVLTGVGVYVASKGLIDQSMADQAVGGLMTLISVAWSIWAKK